MIIIKQLGRGKIQPYQWLSILYIILGYLYKDFSIWRWGKMKKSVHAFQHEHRR